jgi:hypothetical protein
VRRWQERGALAFFRDADGTYRAHPRDVEDFARKNGLNYRPADDTASAAYAHVMAPDFKPTREAIARIVIETQQHPDIVALLWKTFSAPVKSRAQEEMERIAGEYDEQIAAMDAHLAALRARRRG